MNIDVQKLWNSYLVDCIPHAGLMEKRVARQAFFAGAGVVIGIYHVSEGQLSPRLEAQDKLLDEYKRQGKIMLSLVGGSSSRDQDDD